MGRLQQQVRYLPVQLHKPLSLLPGEKAPQHAIVCLFAFFTTE
jgi:hypothetical protein